MGKRLIFLISAVALVAVIAVLFAYYRSDMFSKEILKLEILGPDAAKIGDEITYTVEYKNNGNFVLQSPRLTFVLPDDSLTEDGKIVITQNLNDIYPGDLESVKVKARLVGKDGDLKTAKASLSYIPKNITATYESDTTFITKIDGSPITLNFDLPTQVEQGKNLQYAINYFSDVDYPLENLSIKIDPTPGFNFVSADPVSLDNTEWKLATLNKTQGGRINISGTVSADVNQNLNFSASLGMWQDGDFIVLKQATVQAQVIQPLLLISQQINGLSSYVASPGETLRYQIFFRNIGSTPFNNLSMSLKLDGSALDLTTLQAGQGGQVQPGDNNILVWDGAKTFPLKYLSPQDQGEVDFSVKVKSNLDFSGGDANSATINDEVDISQISQKFSTKVNSGLVISQEGYYGNSEILNSGPVPPKVGQATTYTITWDIKNYLSDTKGVKVKATLPTGVNLTGQIMPQDESSNFSFDSSSREIVWLAGDIAAGTGVTGDPVSLSFQVLLTPTNAQIGSVAQLIGSVQISGENQFTNTIISSKDLGVDTSLPDDFANSGGGIVH